MPFGQTVKEQALTLAARHCCVCRMAKGTRIEVHHIVPEADGGENALDNAIPLCFDCHHDAGHYNDRQPRGNKFRPSELRRQRDKWYETVVRHGLVPAVDDTLAEPS